MNIVKEVKASRQLSVKSYDRSTIADLRSYDLTSLDQHIGEMFSACLITRRWARLNPAMVYAGVFEVRLDRVSRLDSTTASRLGAFSLREVELAPLSCPKEPPQGVACQNFYLDNFGFLHSCNYGSTLARPSGHLLTAPTHSFSSLNEWEDQLHNFLNEKF